MLVHGQLDRGEGDMRYLLDPSVAVKPLATLKRPIAPVHDALALVQLVDILRDLRPDIVHTHMAKAGTLGRVAAAIYNRTAGRDTDLRFEVRDAAGHPVVPEPYMGMAGHAIIAADDFSVFVHAHPNGTISMASQQKFLEREGVADHSMHGMPAATTITFPYAFPKPGRYHLWVQAKVNGEVVTRRFDVTVAPTSS